MTDLALQNIFIIVRAFIVGGFFFLLPMIGRKGLLFGVYVGEKVWEGEQAARLRRGWQKGCVAMIALGSIAGLATSVAGWPRTGTAVCITVIVLLGVLLYGRSHSRARQLVPDSVSEQSNVAIASLHYAEPGAGRLARVALAICCVAGLAFVAHAWINYGDLPDMVRTYFGWTGRPHALSEKSFGTVMVPSVLGLVASCCFGLMAVLSADAKHSIRGGSGGGSIEADAAFRRTWVNLWSGMALFIVAILGYISVQFIRMELQATDSWGLAMLVLPLAALVFMVGGLVRVLKLGQGGSSLEQGSEEAPLTNGIADDSHWLWGMMYFNRSEPSIMVEARFGLGYTMNFGNLWSVVFFLAAQALMIGLVAAAVMGA